MFFKTNCLEHDAIDMFQMLLDAALEPKSKLAGAIARTKNMKAIQMNKQMSQIDPFADNNELFLRTAYGQKNLGMPRLGLEENVANIDSDLMRKFVQENMSPSKCILVANGV